MLVVRRTDQRNARRQIHTRHADVAGLLWMRESMSVAEIWIEPSVGESEGKSSFGTQLRTSPDSGAAGWTVRGVVEIQRGGVRPGDAVASIDRGGNRLETEIDDPHQSVRSERARNKSSDRKKNSQKKQFS